MKTVTGLFRAVLIGTVAFSQIAATAPHKTALFSLVGTWQSVFHAPAGGDVRRVMQITKAGRGYHAVIHSIDETDVPIITSNVMVHGNTITLKFDMNTDPWSDYHRVWKAQLSADGKSLAGPWSGPGLHSIATTYRRVPKASWPVLLSKATLVNVDRGVRDELLDWGGVGRTVVLLSGLGDTGHSFLRIIPALKSRYHVYSVTRRGFGNSDKPKPTKENYSAQRLGEDVAAILTSLNIQKPILIGHSIAGEELSYMGMRYANRLAGLIYLDAGYGQAFDGGIQNPDLTMKPSPGLPSVALAVLHGEASFKGPIAAPILAIFSSPDVDNSLADEALAKAQIDAFAKGLPAATVIRIPNAHHYVYISNTGEVLRDINAFIAKLPH